MTQALLTAKSPTTSTRHVAELRNVCMRFGDKQVLDDVSLAVDPQERLVIIGQSGAGKTTILRLVLGILKPNEGSVFFKRDEVSRLNDHQLEQVRMRMGMVYQDAALLSSLTVRENLALPLQELTNKTRAMGKGEFFNFDSPEQIWEEIRAVWKAGHGITYARLEKGGLQWPCPTEDHQGTTVLHTKSFPSGKRAPLKRIEFAASDETTSLEFPFLLTTGRTLYQFNAGTMTMRTPNIELRPTDTLNISAEDATQLDLRDGERVRVRSHHGEVLVPIRIKQSAKPGELFATFHTSDVFLNRLIGPGRDNAVHTPEYKVVAVRIEKLSAVTQ